MKRTFLAVAPDGTVFSRKSDHDYTHAVLCELNDTDRKESCRVYGSLSFNSSLALAGKSKQKYDGWIMKCTDKPWKRVFVVEVTQA